MTLRRFGAGLVLGLLVASCGGGSSDESWCDVVVASNEIDDEFDLVDPSDATALEAVLAQVDHLAERFRAAAPDEIRTQVEQYADANDALVGIFRDGNYQIDDLDEAAIEQVVDSLDGVEPDIDVYTVAECGVPLGPDDT